MTVDGGRYFGPLKNGKLHGTGRIEWSSGTRYDGQFSAGRMSGKGTLRFPNGQRYEGQFADGQMSGQGRMQMPDGTVYVGELRHDFFHGQGRLVQRDGRKYSGEFRHGLYHGKGAYETPEGEMYRGAFELGEFTGNGTHTRADGSRYEGSFVKWRWQGKGRFVDSMGTVYEGSFVDGQLNGPGTVIGKDGRKYQGELMQWQFHGQGSMTLANGDRYRGGFAYGMYEGKGTLKYAKPRADGRTEDSGIWRYGRLNVEAEQRKAQIGVEQALYGQRALLDSALGSLAPRAPGKINMYLLAIAGDGSQEVFRREVEFVRDQFDARFGTRARSLALINSRNTISSAPMATVTSIREALLSIAARMDREHDILFLFLTSHGSKDHEATLNQNGMSLRGLRAQELAEALRESGIRWKVVVVSACYSGGFIEHLKDDRSLVLTAARHDRRSFGCADDNDFTYFGRAFFRDSLPKSGSFQDAFHAAESLVKQWETKDLKQDKGAGDEAFSLPQMHESSAIREHLKRWWAQR